MAIKQTTLIKQRSNVLFVIGKKPLFDEAFVAVVAVVSVVIVLELAIINHHLHHIILIRLIHSKRLGRFF